VTDRCVQKLHCYASHWRLKTCYGLENSGYRNFVGLPSRARIPLTTSRKEWHIQNRQIATTLRVLLPLTFITKSVLEFCIDHIFKSRWHIYSSTSFRTFLRLLVKRLKLSIDQNGISKTDTLIMSAPGNPEGMTN
jgi:hypothetical protein